MTRCIALIAGIALGVATASDAAAQTAPARGTPKARAPIFNPFASFSLNRFSFNPFGVLQVGPSSPASSGSSAGSSGGEGEGGEVVVAASAVRPPYRPPVRSPYRPPPRPPF
jgi:hypothetical protein